MGWGVFMGGGFQTICMPSSSIHFTLFVGFGSNPFPSSGVTAGGNHFQGQWSTTQGS
jgi:hypothetical protein